QEPHVLPVHDVLEGQGEENEGGRREGGQAPEADLGARGRSGAEAAAPDGKTLDRVLVAPPSGVQRFPLFPAVGVAAGIAAAVGGGEVPFRNAASSLSGASASTAKAPGRGATRAARSAPRS